MAMLMVHSIKYHLYHKTELHWDILMDLKIILNFGLIKELRWVLQSDTLKNLKMVISMIQ